MKEISCFDDLLSLSKTDSVVLANDIDCKGKTIPKLCSIFCGTFDGNDHTIRNLIIDDPVWGDEQKISIFSHLSHATIKNIKFENISYVINNGVYSPSIAGLGVDVSDSVLENITMSVSTSNGKSIPMIYDGAGGSIKNLHYSCNSLEYKIYLYKEGSLYED